MLDKYPLGKKEHIFLDTGRSPFYVRYEHSTRISRDSKDVPLFIIRLWIRIVNSLHV